MFFRHVALVGLVTAGVIGCGAGGPKTSGSDNSGTTGSAGGSTGSSGGTTGSDGGSTGSNGGTTGSNGGSTGSNGGSAGSDGGTTGSSGGTTGSNGGTTGSSGGAGGTTATGGTPGTGGTVASGGTNGVGGRPSGPSAGCNMPPPNEAIGSAVSHNITITGMAQEYVAGYTDRTYCSTMPKNYNPATPYPLVIYGPGCGGLTCEGGPFSGRTDIILIQATKAPKVYNQLVPPVPPAAAPGCFQTGVISTVDSPELNYFDQVVAEAESKYCIDKGRVFVSGSSSGGWFTNYLGCARGNVIRGIAPDSGGIPVDHPPCTGGAGVIEFPGDSAMKKDSMGREIGMALARDLFIKANGCSMTSTPMKFGNDTCDVYGGCDSPVAWCGGVSGGHQAGLSHLNPTGFAFWMTLK